MFHDGKTSRLSPYSRPQIGCELLVIPTLAHVYLSVENSRLTFYRSVATLRPSLGTSSSGCRYCFRIRRQCGWGLRPFLIFRGQEHGAPPISAARRQYDLSSSCVDI